MGMNTPDLMATGNELIREERWRQVYEEGRDSGCDAEYRNDQLACAAACYAMPHDIRVSAIAGAQKAVPALWPWDAKWWKPGFEPPLRDRGHRPSPPRGDEQLVGRIRELVKAGALIAAEIDRLQGKRRELDTERREDEELARKEAQRRQDAEGTDGNP